MEKSNHSTKSITKKIGWSWLESLLLSALLLIGIDFLLGFIVGGTISLLGPSLVENLGENIVLNFAFYITARLVAFGLLWWFVRSRNLTLKSLGFNRFKLKRAAQYFLLAVTVFMLISPVILILLQLIFPEVNLEQEQQNIFLEAKGGLEITLTFIAVAVAAPVFEETIFRGFMFPAFSKRFGIIAGATLTSLLFGLVHGQVNVGVITFILGMLLCWLYYKTKSLWPAILLHSFKNVVAFVLIF